MPRAKARVEPVDVKSLEQQLREARKMLDAQAAEMHKMHKDHTAHLAESLSREREAGEKERSRLEARLSGREYTISVLQHTIVMMTSRDLRR